MPLGAYITLRQQYFTFPEEIYHVPVRGNFKGGCGNPFPQPPLGGRFFAVPSGGKYNPKARVSMVRACFAVDPSLEIVWSSLLLTLSKYGEM